MPGSLVSCNPLLWLLKRRGMGFQSRPVVNFAVRQGERLPGLRKLAFCPLLLQRGALLSPFF